MSNIIEGIGCEALKKDFLITVKKMRVGIVLLHLASLLGTITPVLVRFPTFMFSDYRRKKGKFNFDNLFFSLLTFIVSLIIYNHFLHL